MWFRDFIEKLLNKLLMWILIDLWCLSEGSRSNRRCPGKLRSFRMTKALLKHWGPTMSFKGWYGQPILFCPMDVTLCFLICCSTPKYFQWKNVTLLPLSTLELGWVTFCRFRSVSIVIELHSAFVSSYFLLPVDVFGTCQIILGLSQKVGREVFFLL